MEDNENVFSHGFMEINDENSIGFSFHSLEVKRYIKNDLVCFCVGIECLLMAKRRGTIIRRKLNPDQNFEILKLPREDCEVTKMYMDVYGYHCIMITTEDEYLYLNYIGDMIIPLTKLKGMKVSAVAYNSNTSKDSTDSILLGTNEGLIYLYKIDYIVKRPIEEDPKRLLELPGKTTVFGLVYETYQCRVKGDKRIEETLVMAITKDSCYQFVGKMPFEELFRKYGASSEINKHKRVVPGDKLDESELKLFHKRGRDGKIELHSFVWKCEAGVCYDNFRARNDFEQPITVETFIAEGYQKKDTSNPKKIGTAKAVGITEYSLYFLYSDNVTVISKVTKEVEYSESFYPGEIMIQMHYEIGSKSMWMHSSKGLYRLIVTGANKDLWRQQLSSLNFQGALTLCKENNNKHYSYVAGAYADYKYNNGEYIEAARNYAYSKRPFEEVLIKLLTLDDTEALEEYLIMKLNSINNLKGMKVQRMLIISFLTSLKLEKIHKLSRKVYLNDYFPDTFKRQTADAKSLSELNNFLNEYDESLNEEVTYSLLKNNGRENDAMEFAEQKWNYEILTLQYINIHDINNALRSLTKIRDEKKRNALLIKYGVVFMKYEMEKIMEYLGQPHALVPVWDILPSLLSVEREKRLSVASYLNKVKNQSIPLNNLYLFLLAESSDPDAHNTLLNFLISQQALCGPQMNKITFDVQFALNVFKYFDRKEAQARIYCMLELYEEGVNLALQIDNFKLAKECANIPLDYILRKKLWLDIVKATIQSADSIQKGLQVLAESKGNLTLLDVFPLIVNKMKSETFGNDLKKLLSCLDKDKAKIAHLTKVVEEMNKSAEQIKKYKNYFENRSSTFLSDRDCEACGKNLIGDRKYILFPCLHGFHKICLIHEQFSQDNKIKVKKEKLKQLELFRRNIESLLEKCGVPLERLDGIRTINTASELLINRQIEHRGMTIGINANDYKVLKEYNQKLENCMTDECLLCGNSSIENINLPFESPIEYQWNL